MCVFVLSLDGGLLLSTWMCCFEGGRRDTDPPARTRTTDVPIPFLLSSRGPGLLLASSYRSDWRLDSPGLRQEHLAVPERDEEGALVLMRPVFVGGEEGAATAVARQLRGREGKGEESRESGNDGEEEEDDDSGPGAYEFVVRGCIVC